MITMRVYISTICLLLALSGCRQHVGTTFSLPEVQAKFQLVQANTESTIVEAPSPEGSIVKYLAIHCTASPPGSDLSDIVKLSWWKKNRGWNRWGYHIIIFRDGRVEVLNPAFRLDAVMEPEEIVYGVKGINRHTISIAYVGGVDKALLPEDNMTDAQYHALAGLITATKAAIPAIQIAGHRDFRRMFGKSYKACPSFNTAQKFQAAIGDNFLIQGE